MIDVGLTHIALPVTDMEKTIAFHAKYAGMKVVHRRSDSTENSDVVWMSDGTRPFVIVFIQVPEVRHPLLPFAHLGVACPTREDVDRLADLARAEGVLIDGPHDYGYPVGYWLFLSDPDGHTLELSHGQEIGMIVGGQMKN